jgi:hypothetical protein
MGSRREALQRHLLTKRNMMFASRCPTTRGSLRVVAVVLGLHSALLAWGAWQHSPAYDEVAYLPAGISHWHFNRFDLCRVNPPLVRLLAVLPVLVAHPQTDWRHYDAIPGGIPWFAVGHDFLQANGERSFWYFTLARWACVPLSVMGGYLCFRWSSELYGQTSGMVALILWCFCPSILAYGQLITPDVGAASFGLLGMYVFWRWLKEPTWSWALIVGIVLGLVELVKTTWIILFALWPALWLLCRWPQLRVFPWRHTFREGWQLSVIFLVALYLLNFGFSFEGSLRNLGDSTSR